MEKLNLICIDDQREVLSTLAADLEPLEDFLTLEACESAEEAQEVMDEIDGRGDWVALIISDHVMPGKNGVEFLTEVNQDSRFSRTRKILLTGLATQKDTITAINKARIDHYFEKPWNAKELLKTVRQLLTDFVIEAGMDYQPLMPLLDQPTLLERLRKQV